MHLPKHFFSRRVLTLAMAAMLPAAAAVSVGAVEAPAGPEVAGNAVYCFQTGDFFDSSEQPLQGVFVTAVPDAAVGVLYLENRVIHAGDMLTAEQITRMTFRPADNEDREAELCYLPVFRDTVEPEAQMTIRIRGTQNKVPEVRDISLETYKNLEKSEVLPVSDPEGQTLSYTVTRQPRRGSVELHDDGTFTYTPKKNKVGKDAFSFTATDAAGGVSQEATVTIRILKPLDDKAYTDMRGASSEFEALWLKNTGIFSGVEIAGQECFGPEEQVSRGEFLAMAMELLEIPLVRTPVSSGFADEAGAPAWLKPYLVTAMRLGLVEGCASDVGLVFRPQDPVTGAEAARMLQNVLSLQEDEAAAMAAEAAPVWARRAASALSAAGVTLPELSAPVTRLEAAKLLYQVSKLADTAPGLEVFRAK